MTAAAAAAAPGVWNLLQNSSVVQSEFTLAGLLTCKVNRWRFAAITDGCCMRLTEKQDTTFEGKELLLVLEAQFNISVHSKSADGSVLRDS